MVDYVKDKMINVSTVDLDKCINYLITSAPKETREQMATKTASTIAHWLEKIFHKEVHESQVIEHLKEQKNFAIEKLGRDFYKISEPSAVYICWCFFIFASTSGQAASKSGISKIFSFCENHCSNDMRAGVRSLTNPLRLDFDIPTHEK